MPETTTLSPEAEAMLARAEREMDLIVAAAREGARQAFLWPQISHFTYTCTDLCSSDCPLA